MPQEIRRPDRRTDKADTSVNKILELYGILKAPLPASVQQMAQEAVWPDMTREDKRLFVNSWMYIDELMSLEAKMQIDKQKGEVN